MKPSTEVLLKENLKLLKLSNVLRQLETFIRQAKENGTDYGEFLLGLTDLELQIRAENRLRRRIREAKFPLIKTLQTFDFNAAPGLDLRLLRELETGDYIREHRNIILLGNSGTGKTHLATGLGVAACGQGLITRFVTGCGLANDLIEAQSARNLSRTIQRTARSDLLVLMNSGTFLSPGKAPSFYFRSWPSAMREALSLSQRTWGLPTGPRFLETRQ
jgi:DNA replication protein DnaC